MNAHTFPLNFHGQKSSKGGSGGTTESPNTLRSRAKARLLEILGEGEIEGIVGGAQGIFFDRTPLQNPDGTFNFQGVRWEQRTGQADQPHINGNPYVETPYSVNAKVTNSGGPVVRRVDDQNASAVRVVISIPALASTDDETGRITPASVQYAIDVRSSGGGYVEVINNNIVNEKCTSPTQIAHRVELPLGGYPWDIRVRRLTPDSKLARLQNETHWDSFFTLVEGRFTYPFTALCYLEVDAEQFGTSLPARYYRVRGLKIQVPTNYDPIARTYSGIWDGTFKIAWTNNPAWILYDLISQDRYGLGEFVDFSRIDKWSLYQIAQHCDQGVPSGFKTPAGVDILEPRYTFNGVINTRKEAFKLLQEITTAFRGMAFWSLGQIFATADMPFDAVKLVSPADVIGGRFEYSGTALRARSSVAAVAWNDPDDFYQQAIEIYVSDPMLKRFGWRQKDVQAIGCTSRGLAHRYARWLIDADEFDGDTVKYSASWDHSEIYPGAIIAIADPYKASVRHGGRVVTSTTTAVTLDAPFEAAPGQTYSLMVEQADGTIETRPIVAFSGAITTVFPGFSVAPTANSMWAITGTDVKPRLYRVISVREDNDNYTVIATFHDPQKYGRVERDLKLDPVRYTRPQNTLSKPSNLRADEMLYMENGTAKASILLSWTPSDSFLAAGYIVTGLTPQGFRSFGRVNGISLEIPDTVSGRYIFNVRAVGTTGVESPPAELTFDALGWEGVDPPYVSHLEVHGRGGLTDFFGPDCRVTWRNNFPGTKNEYGSEAAGAGTGVESPFYRNNRVRVFDTDTNQLLREEFVFASTYTYTLAANIADNAGFSRGPSRRFRFEVSVRDTLGRESDAIPLPVSNPAPDVVFPEVRPGVSSIFINYPFADDLDVAGALIWVEKINNFDPMTTRVAFDGTNNFVSIPADAETDYWVRIALYDAFGKTGLNVSPPVYVKTYGTGFETEPPAVPSIPSLSAVVNTLPSGGLSTRLVATWSITSVDRLSYYEVELTPAGGNPVVFTTSSSSYEWSDLIPNTQYNVRVRSVSGLGKPSNYGPDAGIIMPRKEDGPGAPTDLAGVASLRGVFLSWTNPADTDLAETEIWSSSLDARGSAVLIGSSRGKAFTHTGLETGVPIYYWVRSRNTSGVVGEFNADAGLALVPGQVEEGDIAANAVVANHIRAQSITGDKISVTTTFPPTIKIGTTGIELGGLADPAGLINANTTLIEPGKITLSGSTTLASWRGGTDQTKINGGAIETNSIAANSIQIGSRGLSVVGIQFSYSKDTDTLSWNAGSISYVDDNGAARTDEIAAGSAAYISGTLYVAWTKGAGALSASSTVPVGANVVTLASYRGGSNLVANYGRTMVDGENILTRSITAAQLVVGELISDSVQIRGGVIQNVHLAGNITFDRLAGGTLSTSDLIRIGGDRFTLQAANQVMEIRDQQAGFYDGASIPGRVRCRIGKIGAGSTDFGIQIFDAAGSLILGSGGSSFGAFANVNQINASNIASLIGVDTITSTYIQSLSGDKIIANSIVGSKIAANSILASHLNVTSLQAISGNMGTLTAGRILSTDGRIDLNLDAGYFYFAGS